MRVRESRKRASPGGTPPPGPERKRTVNPRTIELPKTYDPKAVEDRLYAQWEAAGFFHEDPDPARPPFIICMPPPNVTARAHLGHGSTYTLMDILTRFARMLGANADWLPGTDHAAIATEAVLVRQLAAQGRSRESLGREAYLKLAWQWSKDTGATINDQFRKLGFGPDWERSRFTMEPHMSQAVTKTFVDFYREGLIYRGTRLINWDPKGRTTVSDAEIEHVERDAHLWRIRYPFAKDGRDGIEIATTRPETMLADVAIAVHPEDERYKALIGKTVLVPPLLTHAIPIIADDVVEMTFGTGAVKVTPAHDQTDYDIGTRHNLEMPSVIDLDGRIMGTQRNVGKYAGLDRFEARKAIVADVDALGLLVEAQPYRHSIATSERSGDVIEPLLSEQWFMSMKSLAKPALDAYHDGRLRFVPARYGRTYEQWLENIRDWNISRQVWWGHQLPVWYTPNGEVVVAHTEEEAQEIAHQQFGSNELRRDDDTLDTWFSSGLWPFSILGWPDRTPELAHWYPSQVLITGWEIIFLWVARMVMLGLKIMGEVPFGDVYISPLVFDAQGRKMSKSLGNAIDPLDLIDRFGADAFRMGLVRQMRLESQEMRFQESRCEEARNFNNKMWNATRYMLSISEGLPTALRLPAAAQFTLADKWILTRLHDLIVHVTQSLHAYDFGTAAEALWKFIWYEFCDWYLESTKIASASRGAVLSFVWNNAMRLLHPIEPFITEELWQALPHDGNTIMTAAWPDEAEVPVDREAAAAFESLQAVVERVRNMRAEMGIAPRAPLTIEIPRSVPDDIAELLAMYVAGTPERTGGPGQPFEDAMAAVVARAPREVLTQRYRKDQAKLHTEIERLEQKLRDEKFTSKAPQSVVNKEREKLQNFKAELQRTQSALAEMGEPA